MSEKERDRAESEAILTMRLGHEVSDFLIKGHEAFITPNKYVCIVLEYAEKGNLKKILSEGFKGNMKKKVKKLINICFQIILAIKFLHDR